MYLSASRIKAYHVCSWSYFCSYTLGFRDFDESNDGAKRGTICHLILELLLTERHRKWISKCIELEPKNCAPIWRLVLKHAADLGVDDEENLKLINSFIITGLKSDFLCEGWDLQEAEKKFHIKNEDPRFEILGFIDKSALDHQKRRVRVDDYKSSKVKFTGKDAHFNIQSLLYSLAFSKEFDYDEFEVNFVFLKFPKKPFQTFKYTRAHLRGFEHYLSNIYNYLDNFNIEKACSNFARNNENYFLCGKWDYKPGDVKKDGSPAWVCPFRLPFLYYELVNSEGKVIKKSKKREELLDIMSEGDKIGEKYYAGCVAFNKKIR